MPQPELTYSVLLARRGDEAALPQALAKADRQPLLDAQPKARAACGLIERGVSEQRARALAQALCEAGVPALAVPDSLVEEAAAPIPLVRASPGDEGLRWEARSASESRLAPWARVKLVAAAGFKRAHSTTIKTTEGPDPARRALGIGLSMMTGLPPSLVGGGPKRDVVKQVNTSELVCFIDVVLDAPAERLRVDAQEFDFSGLGEQKAFDALTNFRRLVAELARRAPAALLSTGSLIVLENRPMREMRCDDLAALEREERWLLTLRALGKI